MQQARESPEDGPGPAVWAQEWLPAAQNRTGSLGFLHAAMRPDQDREENEPAPGTCV